MTTRLTNARVPGGDPADLLVDDGRIVEAAAPSAAAGERSASEEVIDLDGRYVLPGFWDDHVHLSQYAFARRRIDVSGAASAAEAARIMHDATAGRRPDAGQPLVGFGFRDGLWPDRPTAALLDSVLGDLPVVLVSGDLHCCWLSSSALSRFGLTGHPSGILREEQAFLVTVALQDVPEETLDSWVEDAALAAAARGVVGVVDFEMTDNLTVWPRRFAAGFDTLRIAAGVYTEYLETAIAAGHYTGEALGPQLTVGPYKVLMDGSLNTRTAYCVDEYPGLEGTAGSRGVLSVPPSQLIPLLRRASAAGLLPAVHAIGDEANRLALDAFETVGCAGRIEHAQLVREVDLPRFAALGISVSVQPEHAMDDRDVADHYWAGRTDWAFALRSLREAGARLILDSDAPVAPLDPWVGIAAAVSRSRDGRPPWHPEQSIGVAEAILASNHDRAGLAVGETADLVVVDLDPLTVPVDRLRTMPVAATMLAGRWTYNRL